MQTDANNVNNNRSSFNNRHTQHTHLSLTGGPCRHDREEKGGKLPLQNAEKLVKSKKIQTKPKPTPNR
jgi:hypothetical protein